jgi:phage-related minor tail protein
MQEAAANGFDLNARAANRLAAEYQRLSATVGKTQAEILAQRAANTGVTNTFASMQSQIAAASQETHGFSLATGAARRELAVLAHEAGTGNWTRFGGSLGVLAERTGAINLLFSSLGVSILAGAAAVAGIVYEIVKGAEAFNALTKASSATNDYIGMTSGQLKQMAVDLAGTSGSITSASQVLTQLVESGHIAGESLLSAGQAAQAFAAQTGLAADKATEAMIAFAEDPAKALDTLQGKYHEFSQAQIDVIEGFLKQGNAQAAVAAGFADITANSAAMSSSVVKDVGLIEGSYDGWKIKITEVINWLGNLGKASTQADLNAIAPHIQQLVDKRISQRSTGQGGIAYQIRNGMI